MSLSHFDPLANMRVFEDAFTRLLNEPAASRPCRGTRLPNGVAGGPARRAVSADSAATLSLRMPRRLEGRPREGSAGTGVGPAWGSSLGGSHALSFRSRCPGGCGPVRPPGGVADLVVRPS